MIAEVASRLGYSDHEAATATGMVSGLAGPSTITEEDAVELLETARFTRRQVERSIVGRPAAAPGTGGGFANKLPQRERPPPSDDDEEPPTKINPRRTR